MKLIFEQNIADDLTLDQLKSAYKSTFETPAGKIILDDLSIKCGIFRSNFTDPNQMYFLEGQKNLFLYICSYLQETQESIAEIVEE